MINWTRLLRSHGIDYLDQGPSTVKGNIYVKCPWCKGVSDNYHLGIHIGSGRAWKGYGCWKNSQHRGRNEVRLVSALLGIGLYQAQALAEQGDSSIPSDIKERVKKMDGLRSERMLGEEVEKEPLRFPVSIKLIGSGPQSRIFLGYLMRRGYSLADARNIASRYLLRLCMQGAFRYRLIIPIIGPQGLLTWTGRAIGEDQSPRYKSLSPDPEKAKAEDMPIARASISDCLWNEANLWGDVHSVLIVCEGPLDAIRLDYIGRHRLGVHATCLFSKSISDAQLEKLSSLGHHYGKKYLLLDRDAQFDSYRLIEKLRCYGYEVLGIPDGAKDPGEMPLGAIRIMLEEITK